MWPEKNGGGKTSSSSRKKVSGNMQRLDQRNPMKSMVKSLNVKYIDSKNIWISMIHSNVHVISSVEENTIRQRPIKSTLIAKGKKARASKPEKWQRRWKGEGGLNVKHTER